MFVYVISGVIIILLSLIIISSKNNKKRGETISPKPTYIETKESILIQKHLPHFDKIKGIFNSIPTSKIEDIEIVDYIVLDDDNFNEYAIWKPASEKLEFKYHFYTCPFELAKNIYKYPLNTPIVFDSYLKDEVHGEIISKAFFERGHENIYVATGRDMDEFKNNNYYWIKQILPKESISNLNSVL